MYKTFYIIVIFLALISNLYCSDIFDKKFINKDGVYFELKQSSDIFGFSGCNNFAGKVQINVDTKDIKFLNLASTRKFCDDKANKIEADFLQNSQQITNFEYQENDKMLLLKDIKNNILFRFKKI